MRCLPLLLIVPALLAAAAPSAAPPTTLTPPATPPARTAAAPDAAGAPTMDQLIDLMAQQKYPEALRGISKCLALRGAASQPYNRAELLTLRGEAYLHTRSNSQAAESFAQAAKATDDKDQKAIAQATELLIKRSKPTGYVPRTPSTQPNVKPGTPLPIVEKEDRKIAFSALLEDEMAAAGPKVKAATASNSLNPVIDAARALMDLRAIELAAGAGDKKTKSIAERLGQHAHTLISASLQSMKARVEQIWGSASETYHTVDSQTTLRTHMYGMKGMTSIESNDLKDIIATSEKIAPTANDLATVVGGTELSNDASDADKLLQRANEVLHYDYNNEGRDPRKSQEPRKSS